MVKNPPPSSGDLGDSGLIPGSGRSSGGAQGNPLQYSCLENSMDRGVLRATDHRVAKSQTRLKQLSMHAKTPNIFDLAFIKTQHSKTKIMASGPIISWQIDGETVEIVSDFIFLGSKITADSDCSHEIKRHLLLGRKAMTNLDSILKSRDITLPARVCIVKTQWT